MSTPIVVNPVEPVDYSSSNTPSSYVCRECGKPGVKLWREYQAPLSQLTLLCVDDAANEAGMDGAAVLTDGTHVDDLMGITVHIGSRLPAIPTPGNDNFWGYSSTPPAGYEWWQRLPLR